MNLCRVLCSAQPLCTPLEAVPPPPFSLHGAWGSVGYLGAEITLDADSGAFVQLKCVCQEDPGDLS